MIVIWEGEGGGSSQIVVAPFEAALRAAERLLRQRVGAVATTRGGKRDGVGVLLYGTRRYRPLAAGRRDLSHRREARPLFKDDGGDSSDDDNDEDGLWTDGNWSTENDDLDADAAAEQLADQIKRFNFAQEEPRDRLSDFATKVRGGTVGSQSTQTQPIFANPTSTGIGNIGTLATAGKAVNDIFKFFG